MDHGRKAGVGFVAAHGYAFELLEFAEEILDEMAPAIDFGVDGKRIRALWTLGDDDCGAALVELSDNPVGIERFVGDQRIELDALDQRGDTDRVMSLAGQQHEAHQIAQRVGQRQNLGRQAASGFADRLTLSPPLEPWP